MTERLDDGVESAEPKKGLWEEVLEHDDDTELSLVITDMDGSNPRGGTIRVGDVREQVTDPGYQAMMRRARQNIEDHPEEFGQA